MTQSTPNQVELELTTTAAASVETVWDCFVGAIDEWWGEPYVASEERKSLRLDATVGGHLFEDWGNGNGLIWATVRAMRKPREIEFDGTFNMAGALAGRATITFEASGDGTEIRVHQTAVGLISEETTGRFVSGWSSLFGKLAETVEARP